LVMTNWKRRWIVGFWGAALMVAMTVFPVLADEGHGQMGDGGHDQDEQQDHSGHYLKHLLKHAKEIGLTPEQISKLKSLQLDFKRTEARLEADTKVAELELHALMEDEQADLNAIQAKVEQLKKAEGACLVAAIKSKRNAMAMLTPDQRDKERLAHEQMKSGAQHGGGMGGMMGGRGGMGGMMGGMGGMMGSMGGSGQGQGSGDHGSGGSSGGQQHQH
jgi:Spy/CpxP family protein refolding chaperone